LSLPCFYDFDSPSFIFFHESDKEIARREVENALAEVGKKVSFE